MIKAAKSFDFSYDTVFSTYAVPHIMGEIRRHLRDDGPIKVGRKVRSQGLALLRAREAYLAQYGSEPKLSTLCQMLGMEPEEAAAALTACAAPRSLEEKTGGEEEGMSLSQMLPDPENAVDKITDKLALSQAVASLEPLQKQILYLRYVKELSQQHTGRLLGLSQVKISREEKKILQLLRKAL
jgi:RNA polymerase sporulation-specific sigma factor